MIGQLFGILLEKNPPTLLLRAGHVGYELDASLSTFGRLPELGQELTLYTHLVVREDAQQLYGFYTRDERTLFRTLLRVNGVGPRLALTILSSLQPEEFVSAVANQDSDKLVGIPGIGKKTAERLLIEMRDKVKDWALQLSLNTSSASSHQPARNQAFQDAISALVALGYKPQVASRAVARVDQENLSSEEMIKRALQEVAS